ncbi:MAG: ABC transporter substrate-binding protein, partial [Bacillota bacterium]|nr:ABC transporter substrate-binding protein [Bacillota bacterium]
MLRKLMVLAVAGALVLGALAGCAGSKPETKPESKPAEEQVIKIGHEVALTGDSSMWGQSEKNALEMVIEKINKEGGVLGKQIKLISYDNRADATEGVNVARR